MYCTMCMWGLVSTWFKKGQEGAIVSMDQPNQLSTIYELDKIMGNIAVLIYDHQHILHVPHGILPSPAFSHIICPV